MRTTNIPTRRSDLPSGRNRRARRTRIVSVAVIGALALGALATAVIPFTSSTSTTTITDARHDTYRGSDWAVTARRTRGLAEIEKATYQVDGDQLTATIELAKLRVRPAGVTHTIAIRGTVRGGTTDHALKLTGQPGVYESLAVDGAPACPGQVSARLDRRHSTVTYAVPRTCLPSGRVLTDLVAESWIAHDDPDAAGTYSTIARDASSPAAVDLD